jgi:dihydrofolate reductase
MAKLIYTTNVSVDGYIEDETGDFAFFPVDDEVFASHTELVRSVDTILYGRRLYELMSVWETDRDLAAQSAANTDFSTAWQASEKIVYSRTATEASTGRTRIERSFSPADIEKVKATATGDILIGGADLAAQAIQAGLVDEIQLYVLPVILGGGKAGLSPGIRGALELLGERRFANGVVLLRYRPTA